MNRRIRILAVALVGCFLLLFLQLNNLQVRQASSLQKTSNQLLSAPVDPMTEPRGEIVSADGQVLARSTATNDGYGELRSYPDGKLFADITGYFDVVQDAAPLGIEAEYDRYLSYHETSAKTLQQLLTTENGTDSVVLTVPKELQDVAQRAFASECPGEPGGCQKGAVVALDVRTGAVLTMYGLPTYDPNLLSSHDKALVEKTYTELTDIPASEGGAGSSPLINFATGQTIAPGSTMKVVTSSAIFDHDPSLASHTWPSVSRITLPDTTATLSNFAGEVCGGTLAEVLARSCDTAFADIGLSLGVQNLVDEAQAFGFDSTPPLDLPSGEVQPAVIPSVAALEREGKPFLAYSAIGQGNVQESALTDAMIAAAIGDGGKMMAPHLMQHVVDDVGNVVASYRPHVWRVATSAATAASVRSLMRGVATTGTAAGVFPADLDVAAKTGTAETVNGCSANWMIATAPADPGQTPQVAVAAVLPYQQGLSCGDTGATVAGPIVSEVLQAALAYVENSTKGKP